MCSSHLLACVCLSAHIIITHLHLDDCRENGVCLLSPLLVVCLPFAPGLFHVLNFFIAFFQTSKPKPNPTWPRYELCCPYCSKHPLSGLYFVEFESEDGWEEYCCCTDCIDEVSIRIKVKKLAWKKYPSDTDIWKSGDRASWQPALLQTKHLKNLPKPKKTRRKRKRKRSVPAPAPAPAAAPAEASAPEPAPTPKKTKEAVPDPTPAPAPTTVTVTDTSTAPAPTTTVPAPAPEPAEAATSTTTTVAVAHPSTRGKSPRVLVHPNVVFANAHNDLTRIYGEIRGILLRIQSVVPASLIANPLPQQ